MKILGYHINNKAIVNSDGEVRVESPYLDFLLQPRQDTIKVFYHMGYNLANLLKMIGTTEGEAKDLQDKQKLYLSPYVLKHIAGKFFSVKKGHFFGCPFANFSDMSQYKSAKFEEYESVGRCIEKAKEAKQTGEIVYQALQSIGLHPTSLTSPIKSYEKEVLSKMSIPTVDDMPDEVGEYAYQCCKGNWLEAFQMGHWDQVWDYDINSAYPAELIQLLDLRQGEWIKSDGWISDSIYGYCKGTVDISAPFSPIIYGKGSSGPESLNYTPTGARETILRKQEIEHIYKWKQGTFEIIDGWWWIPNQSQPKRLLKSIIEQLYLQKGQSSGLSKEVIKRAMSGIWGKFLETRGDGFGDRFNPVYGAEVESNVKLRVAEFALQNGINPVHIAVDGLISPKPIVLNSNGSEIGKWELTTVASCISAGTAMVAIKGKEKTADFSLDYDWLVEQIKENPEAKEYKMIKLAPITLAIALKGNWDKLGQLHEITKVVTIGNEIKRCYREVPKCGQDLLNRQYDSLPWDISMISRPS